ncbi:hypothetical protein FB567DRAFT_79424 [Paraphoma chrysanthemicola]|uniref:Uncharacterized protein n=1 Tax=Paraphoma chrysanthemicola TaxID=798071 RepID=A0A8K0VWR4_9PLEO|nr:hypothetical protein FB567DRAFT_79424 [Paraphoma chrysanthemicola]
MSTGKSAFVVSAAPNMRKRRSGRTYVINNLLEGLTKPLHTHLKYIHEVLCYNIWVDLIGLHISNATEDQFRNSSRYPYFALRMRAGLPEELLKISEELDDTIYDLRAKDHIMKFVQTMAFEDAVTYLDNCDSARFYRDMMNNQICFVKDLRVLAHGTNETAKIERSCHVTHMRTSQGFSKWTGEPREAVYSHFTSLNENRLIFLLKILREFRASIAVAASAGHVPFDVLSKLRLRLREFDQRGLYSLACSIVAWASPEESQFVADSKTWWDTSSAGKHGAALPEKVAHAYASGEKTRSTLTFIVPTIMLISVIPAAVAWRRDDSVTGTTGDSNFWQAVSSSTLQLLSLITFIWPAMKDPRLSQITWVWIWVLAGFSATCTIAHVPVYLVAPTIWSFVISFVGALAQSIVQLQVVNAA